jgi:hypothetical protein
MSGWGQKRLWGERYRLSGLPPRADTAAITSEVSYGPDTEEGSNEGLSLYSVQNNEIAARALEPEINYLLIVG